MLNLVIAESALELVPEEVAGHPSVRSDSRRRGLEPSRILLDRSLHHEAMVRLKEDYKRGRPDLVHLTLLSVTSTPLYQSGRVRVFIHTRDDAVLELREGTRPPKSYFRFRDLVQKVLAERPSSGLIAYREWTIPALLRTLAPDLAVGLSVEGRREELGALAAELARASNAAVLVGGFPKGHFSPGTVRSLDRLVRIDEGSLDAHVVVARLVYEVERSSSTRATS